MASNNKVNKENKNFLLLKKLIFTEMQILQDDNCLFCEK